jgi:hypothetical protein
MFRSRSNHIGKKPFNRELKSQSIFALSTNFYQYMHGHDNERCYFCCQFLNWKDKLSFQISLDVTPAH